MARRAARTTRRRRTAQTTTQWPWSRRRTRRKRFVLRWYHLIASSIGAFALGYLVAFGQATTYVAQVVGLR